MNTIGKILVVFVTALSLGFLAFAAAFRNGGPDWKGEMRSPELQREFMFVTEPGDTPKYSAINRKAEKSISDKKLVMAEVVLDARKTLEQELSNKQRDLDPQIPKLQKDLKDITDSIAADKAGVAAREKNLNDQFQKLWQQLEVTGDQYSQMTVLTQDVMKVLQERREEALRLSNQLALLRNDLFAAEDQRLKLDNELVRLEQNRQRLQQRNDQLKKQLNEGY
jgi:hypothetical protein